MPIIRDYDKIKAINNSLLKHFKRSPEHYIFRKHNPEPRKEYFSFGVAFHVYCLEPEKFKDEIWVMDESTRPVPEKDYKTKVNREWKQNQIDEAAKAGREIITAVDLEKIQRMRDKLYSVDQARELLEYTRNKFEQVSEWSWKRTRCKCLRDITNDVFIADLKTTINADPGTWIRSDFFSNDYYRQAGMYLDGDAKGKLNFGNMKDFYYIVIEKSYPFGVAVYKPSEETIAYGVNEYRELVEKFADCKRQSVWGGYETKSLMGEPFEIGLPYYLRNPLE